ncbi:hypothetical protein BS47DRAFT_666493 [Hydnum rufescens UP504]|uniref:Uncharacterized protein n=1 Tax=Hydnum rufescens UP504 TaxID=1448309 RepID=A0A9P6B552_9AGAM|nr:hypothetical protein BS47DRAFT_666493 [Hydnum rufescens UP504]
MRIYLAVNNGRIIHRLYNNRISADSFLELASPPSYHHGVLAEHSIFIRDRVVTVGPQ